MLRQRPAGASCRGADHGGRGENFGGETTPLPRSYRAVVNTSTRDEFMADQNIAQDSGSHERVAYDLWKSLNHLAPNKSTDADKLKVQLALFAQCRKAAYGAQFDLSQLT